MADELVRAIAASLDTLPPIVTARVQSVESDGTVTVDLGAGRVIPGCLVLSSYSPGSGDSVQVMRRDESSFLVLGTVRDSAPTAITVSAGVSLAYNLNATGGAVTPTVKSGTLTVSAAQTSSYRSADGWAHSQAYQGAYSPSLGYYRGCYFYGSGAFDSIKGTTVTRVRIELHRFNGGGVAGAEDVWVAPHRHATRPSGSPLWAASAQKLGTMAWGATTTYDLPVAWGQALVDGTARGFGHIKDSTAAYSIFEDVAAVAGSGKLTIDWTA